MLAPKSHNSPEGQKPKPNNVILKPSYAQMKQEKPGQQEAIPRRAANGKMAVFMGRGKLQTKLKVGAPNDKFEKEADSVADTVVNRTAEPNIQKSAAPPPIQTMKVNSTDLQRVTENEEAVQMKESEEEVQMKSTATPIQRMESDSSDEETAQLKSEDEDSDVQMKSEDEDSDVQMKSEEDGSDVQMKSEEDDSDVQMMEDEDVQTKLDDAPSLPPSTVPSDLKSSKGAGQPLDTETKSQMETGFGHDLSGVKVHTDSRAVSMNKELGAKAFTNGADIYFNDGNYRPDTKEGQQLLAHELTHTLQQGAVDKKLNPEENPDGKAADPNKKEEKPEGENVEAEGAPGVEEEEAVPAPEFGQTTGNPLDAWMEDQLELSQIEPLSEEEEEEELEPINPLEDPDFMDVMDNISDEADEQTEHDPADELSMDAQDAALSPANEADSLAEVEQVDEMEAQEPKKFDAASFKAMLMKRIKEMQLPKNNDEADDFENHNNIDEVNEASMGDVAAEKDKAGGAIEQSTEKEPQVKSQHKRKAEALPPVKKGKKPKGVNAETAVPKPRPDKEVSEPLKNDAAKMDHAMAENDVTDHQLEISQEPSFQQALTSKTEAKTDAETAPQAFRAQESSVIENNSSKAKAASEEELQGMKILNNNTVNKVVGGQKETGNKDTSERERIAGEINAIYDKTKTDVTGILSDLDTKVESMFTKASDKAKAKFEKYCADKMAQYKYDRYLSQVGGWALWTYDLFAGLPDEVNQFYVDGRQIFVDTMDSEIDKIAVVVATELNRATQRIEDGKQEVNTYVEELPSNLKKFGKEAASDIQDKFNELAEDVNSKQEDLVDMLAEEYVASLEEVDARIEEMKAANRGLIDMAMDFINGVIETIRKLKEAIMGLLSAIASAISVIMADPIGFMETLFDGIGKGIDLFKANIQNHLLGGLLEWLTGAMGPMGIQMPNDIFSLSGVFDLTMQVLGLGWDYLRLKAVNAMGEPVVKALESGWDMFKTFSTKGVMGIWEYIKDKFQDLQETVIGAIKEMLITKVIEAGIKWLLSLLIPGAGFIKAIMAIKDIIVFFVESAIMLIPAITDAILALASGNLAGVAKAIEFGLAKLITLVIGLFARLIGLGDLAKKVQKIFKKIRKRIDTAVRKLLQKAKRAGRRIMRKLGLTKKTKKGGKENDPKKQAKIDKGLAFLNKEEKKYLEGGKITLEGAEKAAKATKSKHKVFTSFKVIDGKDSWDYKYTASPETTVEGEKKKAEEDDLKIEVGTTFSIQPKKNWYSAVIEKVQKSKRTFDYKFDYEKYRAGLTRMKFSMWTEGIKNGTIATMEPNRRKKIMAEANKHDEPLKGLIIGTLGGYRGNLIADLQELIKSEGGKIEFKNMYKNADEGFRSKIDALIGKKPVTKSDFKELFKGFEAHHVIPANFLRNNTIVQKLLKQPEIEFGYNYLDNLIFIPAGNHTVGKQRGHPEYDAIISKKIETRLIPYMEKRDYKAALAELKKIINEVKNKFINEIIGSEKTAKNI